MANEPKNIKLLRERYLDAQLYPPTGDVFLTVSHGENDTRSRNLTKYQAQYLLDHPERERDLWLDRLPRDWPDVSPDEAN